MKKGSKMTEEQRKKISENHADMSGEKNPMYGKTHSEEALEKMHIINAGKGNPFYGRKHSEETLEKMRNSAKDRGQEYRNKLSRSLKGRIISEETREKISKAHMGLLKGEKNHNWNPNLTDEDRQDRRLLPKYGEWRKAVYERDGYACQSCGDNKGNNLNAHHIEGYSYNKELRTVVENGITFCKTCHKDFHHQHGIESTTEKVNEFLRENIYNDNTNLRFKYYFI